MLLVGLADAASCREYAASTRLQGWAQSGGACAGVLALICCPYLLFLVHPVCQVCCCRARACQRHAHVGVEVVPVSFDQQGVLEPAVPDGPRHELARPYDLQWVANGAQMQLARDALSKAAACSRM
jgi:hypothetical protein